MPSITGREVGPIGFGMRSLTHPSSNVPQEEAIQLLKAALEAGANYWNAGTIYGTSDYHSLHLLNAYFTKFPADADRVVVNVKGCFSLEERKATADAKGVRQSLEDCLAILDGKCKIDVFEAARLDPDVGVEETVGAIAEFVRAGKIGGVGLSECSAASIRKAAKIYTVACVEVEVSLFDTDVFENGIVEACRDFDIPIAAYSPLSKGFLTGQLKSYDDLPKDDYRHLFPRFQKDVFDENLKLVDAVKAVAGREGCTVGQVALAWVCAQGENAGVAIIPIPGSSKISRVEENSKAVKLSLGELEQMDDLLKKIEFKGGRAPPQLSRFLEV